MNFWELIFFIFFLGVSVFGSSPRIYGENGLLKLQFGASDVFLLSDPRVVEEALCGENLEAFGETFWGEALDHGGSYPVLITVNVET